MNNDIFYTKDPESGKKPTQKQMDVILALNPFEGKITYKQVAEKLGISEKSIRKRMSGFKERCPFFYKRFKSIRKKDSIKRHKPKTFSCDNELIELLVAQKKVKEIF